MSRRQLTDAHILRSFNEGMVSRKEAAEKMGKSQRQVTRLAKGMREEGESALIHKNTGRKPSHALAEDIKEKIVEIRNRDEYRECNVKHFQELLERVEGIIISYTPLYALLKTAGIESPKKHRKRVKHRRRKRKPQEGEMVQIDATPFDWFGEGKMYSLHGSIDDATGKPTGLYICETECQHGYFEVMRQTVLNFGVPLSAYSDKHTIFRSPLTDKKAEQGEESNLTQFGRALDELGTSLIFAHSAQAKGRIERLWGTLQSRLPVEFRIRGITTIEEANRFLAEEFIQLFSEKFAIESEGIDGIKNIFVPWQRDEEIDNILCVKEERTADNAGVFSFKGQKFKVADDGYPLIPVRAKIEVLVSIRGGVRVRYKGRIFSTRPYFEQSKPKKKPSAKKAEKASRHVKPHLLHSTDEWKKIWHQETYDDSLTFLYELFFKDQQPAKELVA